MFLDFAPKKEKEKVFMGGQGFFFWGGGGVFYIDILKHENKIGKKH